MQSDGTENGILSSVLCSGSVTCAMQKCKHSESTAKSTAILDSLHPWFCVAAVAQCDGHAACATVAV